MGAGSMPGRFYKSFEMGVDRMQPCQEAGLFGGGGIARPFRK